MDDFKNYLNENAGEMPTEENISDDSITDTTERLGSDTKKTDIYTDPEAKESNIQYNENTDIQAATSAEGMQNTEGAGNIFDTGNKTESSAAFSEQVYSDQNIGYAEDIHKKRAAFRKTVALGLVGSVLFGMSLGGSLGVAYNGSRNLFVKSAKPFDFSDTANEKEAEVINYDITPTNESIIDTINSVQNAIVNISMVEQQRGWFNQIYESEGAGSGIIYDKNDEKIFIVTNNHVVADASQVSVSITGKESVKATLVGKDATNDLAVISVLRSDLKAAGIDDVTTAQFGDSDAVQVGEYVLAIGNALGRGKTTTRGIISAQNKTINIDGKKMTMIQTDAAINPGNSGGALVNSAGQVIGINTAKYSSSSIEGTGFAIPVNTAKNIIEQLVANGTVDRPYLGIVGFDINDDFRQMYGLNVKGVYIREVESGSGAEKAGLVVSDIITGIDGVEVDKMETLSSEIAKHKSGDTITLNVLRNGNTNITLSAVLGNQNEGF